MGNCVTKIYFLEGFQLPIPSSDGGIYMGSYYGTRRESVPPTLFGARVPNMEIVRDEDASFIIPRYRGMSGWIPFNVGG